MKKGVAALTGAAVLALVLLAVNGVSYAATGHGLILGTTNAANKVTTLARTGGGPALSIRTKQSSPPLVVTSKAKVKRLNADTVDGMDGKSLQTQAYRYSLPAVSAVGQAVFTMPNLPKGVYDANFNVFATMSNPGENVNCHFQDVHSDFQLLTYGGVYNTWSTVSGAGILDTRHGGPYLFRCFSSAGTFSTDGLPKHSSISLIRVDHVNGHAAVISPRVAHGSKTKPLAPTGR